MDVIFWDRKHGNWVKASQLSKTRVIADLIQGDRQETSMLDKPISELMEHEVLEGGTTFPGALSWHEVTIGELGYKSPSCPSYMNFDRHLMLSDLVFIGFEEGP